MIQYDPLLLFKSLADKTRLRCIFLLVKQGELCVCELTHALALAQPKISHHLAYLRKMGLVSDRKAGLWIYYKIHPALPQWVINMLETTMQGINKETPFVNDLISLHEMSNRPENSCKN